ncbi:MAG: hemolysin family protein [Anaerolineae bacterium]
MESLTATTIIMRLLAVLALVAANGFFVAVEFAVVSVGERRARLEQMATQGNAGARRVLSDLLRDPDRIIAASQVGITVASLAIGALGERTVSLLVEPYLESGIHLAELYLGPGLVGWLPGLVGALGTLISLGSITIVHTVLGEQVPKTVAIRHAEQTSIAVVRPMDAFIRLAGPFVSLLDWLTDRTLRLIKQQPLEGHRTLYTAQELQALVRESQAGGVLEADQATMARRVFEFADRLAYEVMVPRPEVIGVERSASLRELLTIFQTHSHARFPVYGEDLDDVLGIVSIKDVLRCIADDPACLDQSVETLARPTLEVPETGRVADLLERMRAEQKQMALVIDEYGGTAGVVTMEQLVEEIVGRMSDELFKGKALIRKLPDGSYQVNAQMRVDEVNESTGWSIPEHDEYETLAGFILYRLGRVPQEGDVCNYKSLRFQVSRMKGPRIEEVVVTRKEA